MLRQELDVDNGEELDVVNVEELDAENGGDDLDIESDLVGDGQSVVEQMDATDSGVIDDQSEVEQVRDVGDQDQSGLGKFGCIPCGMRFRDGGNLKRHVTLVHQIRTTPVKCPRAWCKEEFTILVDMLRHKENCLMMCPYPDCSKKFKKRSRFDGHQRAHLVMTRRMVDE